MPEKIDNLIYEQTETTGTGDLTISAQTGWRSFNTAFGTGTTFRYCVRHQDADEWEIGEGTLTDSTTLSRDTVVASSNAGSAVDFSAGTKDVICDVDDAYFDTAARSALHDQSDLGNLGSSPSPTLTTGWIHTATVSENLDTWDNLSLSNGDVVTLHLDNSGGYTVSTTGLTAAVSGGLSAIEASTVDLTIWQINSTRYAIATEVP